MDCELPSSVAVRERRTDPEGAPKNFVIPHGTDVRLEGGNHEDAGIPVCRGFGAACRSFVFHASLHHCIRKLNSLRLSPQAFHPFAEGSDEVQGCSVDLEFSGSQVVCVRYRSVVNGLEIWERKTVPYSKFG